MRNTIKLSREITTRPGDEKCREKGDYKTENRSDKSETNANCLHTNQPSVKSGIASNVFRLQTANDLQYIRYEEKQCAIPYRDSVCALCEKTVSLALSIPLVSIQAKTRSSAEVALARQIAMYLSHTMFSILLTEVGLYFKRDRTTVSYACALIEDKRDEVSFDLMICQLESLLTDARQAMSICVETEPRINKQSDTTIERTTSGIKSLLTTGGVR